jgi:RNA polymerase sigma-70 factor, ECF subfamily
VTLLSVALSESAPEMAAKSDAAVRDRDERARRLLDDYMLVVWRFMRRLGVNGADTDDATQEVFVVAARRLNEIQPGCEQAFLLGTALRVAATRRRTLRRHPVDVDGSDLAAGRRLLERALNEMSLEQRTVFSLFELEELSAPEIAELLDIPLSTVTARLRHSRKLFEAFVKRLRAREDFAKWRLP